MHLLHGFFYKIGHYGCEVCISGNSNNNNNHHQHQHHQYDQYFNKIYHNKFLHFVFFLRIYYPSCLNEGRNTTMTFTS